MTRSLGTVIYNETIFTITSITLKDGLVWFNSQCPGPVTVPPEGEFRIHDPDGNLVMVAYQRCEPYETQHASRDGTMYLPLSASLDTEWPTPEFERD